MNKIFCADSVLCSVPNVLDYKHFIFCTDCSVCSYGYVPSLCFACNKCSENTIGIAIAAIMLLLTIPVIGFVLVFLLSDELPGYKNTSNSWLVTTWKRPLQSAKIVIVAWQILTQVGESDCHLF